MSTATVTQEAVIEVPTMPDVIVKNRDIFLGILRITPEERRVRYSYFIPIHQPQVMRVEGCCVLGLAFLATGLLNDEQRWVRETVTAALGIDLQASMAIDDINYGEMQTFAMTADWLEAKFTSDDPLWNRIPAAHEEVHPLVDAPVVFV